MGFIYRDLLHLKQCRRFTCALNSSTAAFRGLLFLSQRFALFELPHKINRINYNSLLHLRIITACAALW